MTNTPGRNYEISAAFEQYTHPDAICLLFRYFEISPKYQYTFHVRFYIVFL